jgi:carboxyl-terminal processing protease
MVERGKITILVLAALVVLYVVIGGFLGKVVATDDTYRNLSIFNDVLKKIQDEYVEKPNLQVMTLDSLKGLAEGVDFFSAYLTPEEYQFVKTRNQQPADIGVVLSPRSGYYRVMQVLADSPAEKAQVYPGDVIEEIDGKGVSEQSYPYILAMLRGEPGSAVKLGLQRGRDDNLTEITVEREIVPPPPVEVKILEPGIGYVKLTQIHDHTPDDVRKALTTLASSDMKELVLDLRDCSHGSSEAAIAIADLFLDKGVIAISQGRASGETALSAKPETTLFHGPMVTLINGYTNGAAEIVAGALKDNGQSRLVGQKTFGTASIQQWIELEDGSALYLTTSRFLTPSKRSIMNTKYNLAGINADVKSPPEDFALSQYIDYELATGKEAHEYYKKYIDSVYEKQMEKALEVLKEAAAPKPAAS